jgi:hypothetical protein
MYFLRGESNEAGGFGTWNTSEIGAPRTRERGLEASRRGRIPGQLARGTAGQAGKEEDRQGGEVRDRGAERRCGAARHPGREPPTPLHEWGLHPRLPGVRIPRRVGSYRREPHCFGKQLDLLCPPCLKDLERRLRSHPQSSVWRVDRGAGERRQRGSGRRTRKVDGLRGESAGNRAGGSSRHVLGNGA